MYVSNGGGHEATLDLLEALAKGGLSFGGFADDEGKYPERWKKVRDKLGELLFRWPSGCIEENIINAVINENLEKLITDSAGKKIGMRLRTLWDRLSLGDGAVGFETIKAKAGDNLKAVIVAAATGLVPVGKDDEKKKYQGEAQNWFKTVEGGQELADKMFTLDVWPILKTQLLPFCNAVRVAIGLEEQEDLVACNRQSGSDPAPRIGIRPLHGFRGPIVVADIAHQFPFEIVLRREDAASNHIPLDLGEPQFDLVEPGRVGGREMQTDCGMVVQEGVHLLGLMRREIVEDDVQRLPPRLMGHQVGQERDELRRGVSFGGTPEHRAAASLERGIEREGAVTGIFKAMPLDTTGRQWQHWIQPIQRLDRRLLIHTEDGGMLRRIHVQPNDISRLALEVGIVRRHVPLEAMRLEAMPGPDPSHHHMGDPQRLRQSPRTPVRRPVLRSPAGPVQNLGVQLGSEHRRGLSSMPTVEARQSLGCKALTPAGNVTIAAAELPANLRPTGALGQQHNTPCPPGIIRSAFATVAAPFQFPSFQVCQGHGVLPCGRPVYTTVSVVTGH